MRLYKEIVLLVMACSCSLAAAQERAVLKHKVKVLHLAISPGPLKGHTKEIVAVAFSPDGKTLASACKDGTVKLWDVAGRKELATLEGHRPWACCLAFSPDGKTLAVGEGKKVRLWDVAKATERDSFEVEPSVASLAYGPKGKILATGGRVFTLEGVSGGKKRIPLKEYACGANCVAFSPDGKKVALGGTQGVAEPSEVILWDVDAWKEIVRLKCAGPIQSLAFSPDGKRLAAGGLRLKKTTELVGTVHLWDVETRKDRAGFTIPAGGVLGVTFTPDGKMMAYASESGTVKFLDAVSGRELRNEGISVMDMVCLAFSPDGKTLATGFRDGALQLWNVAGMP